MSKNYELLQQVDFEIGSAPTFTAGESSVVTENIAPASSNVVPLVEPIARDEAMKLVQRLFLIPQQPAPTAVLFAAVDANHGCKWLCSLTASFLARSVPGSICLVEADLRTARSARVSPVERDRGLVDALQLDGSIRNFTRLIGPNNLWLLPPGARVQDSTLLLNSDRLRDRFAELRREFEYIVVNAPPLSAFSDGLVLGRLVDGVVLVLEANATRREAAVRVTECLRKSNIPVLGAVLNNRTFPIPAAVYKRI